MLERFKRAFSATRLRRRLLLGGVALVALWFVFFDSHSLLKRAQYARERSELIDEVQRLREENAALEARLERGLTDEVIEQVAREDYGMRRTGETVYPVEAP